MTRLLKHKANIEVSVFKYLISIFIVVSTLIVTSLFYNNRTSVTFIELADDLVYTVDHENQLYLAERKLFNLKKSLNILSPGPHVLHYDTSPVTRYYAQFNVKKGENYIKPVFNFHSLPSLSIFRMHTKKGSGSIKNKKTFNYVTLAENNTTRNNSLTISIGLDIKKNNSDFICNYSWDVSLNGNRISEKKYTESSNNLKNQNMSREIIYTNSSHYYYAEHFLKNGSAKLKIGAEYL